MSENGTNMNNNERNVSSTKIENAIYEKSSTKESNKDYSEDSNSSDGKSEKSDKDSESSHECNCDMSHGEDEEHNYNVTYTETNNNMKKKIPNSNFYEKQINNKRENEKKNEILRKRKEEEARNRAKPIINESSKKMMEKKQGFVKPIFERAKEIEESKKNKLENLKKGIEEKKLKKEEEEIVKMKNKKKNKEYNEKDFEEWRINQLRWETEKKKKIENIKEQNQKNQLDTLSKFYHPSIDKNSETLAFKSKVLKGTKGNENAKNVFDKLYSQNEERQKKLIQKTLESLPDFRPHINKKVPNFMKNRPKSSVKNNYDFLSTDSKIASTTKNINTITYVTLTTNANTETKTINNTISNIPQSEKTQKSRGMNNSTIETYNNPIIMSNSEDESDEEKLPVITEVEVHEDVVTKYRQALENANHTPVVVNKVIKEANVSEICNISMQSKNTNIKTDNSKLTINKIVPKPKSIPGLSSVYSSDRNKEKLEMYNQKINALLNCLKKSDKKK